MHQFFKFQTSLWPNSHIHLSMTTGKTIALIIQVFIVKVMPLLVNMLSRFVISFLLRSRHILISWLQSSSAVILEPKKVKSVTASTPSIYHEVMCWIPGSSFSECWALSQLFHSPLSPSSRGFLVLVFLPWACYQLHIWGCYISPGNLDSSLRFIQDSILQNVLCIEVK